MSIRHSFVSWKNNLVFCRFAAALIYLMIIKEINSLWAILNLFKMVFDSEMIGILLARKVFGPRKERAHYTNLEYNVHHHIIPAISRSHQGLERIVYGKEHCGQWDPPRLCTMLNAILLPFYWFKGFNYYMLVTSHKEKEKKSAKVTSNNSSLQTPQNSIITKYRNTFPQKHHKISIQQNSKTISKANNTLVLQTESSTLRKSKWEFFRSYVANSREPWD